MQRDDVVLYADGGDMTVGRRTAVYTYGNFQVIIPDDREQEEGDDRLQDGYISRPTERPTGRFDIGFVRADTTIDLNAGTSDLESVIDTAQKRSEGDIFFERDISGRGLGRYQIGVDFDTDDVVQVEVWGKRLPLPVTSAEMVVGESDGAEAQRVHVGGQLVADAEALRKHNDDLLQQIASEKRQRLKEVGAVRRTASSAKDTAEDALAQVSDADGTFQSRLEESRRLIEEGREHAEAVEGHVVEADRLAGVADGYARDAVAAADAADQILATIEGNEQAVAEALAQVSALHEQVTANVTLAQQAVADGQAHVEEAGRQVTLAQGHAGAALDYAREAGILVDEAEQLNESISGMATQIEGLVTEGQASASAAQAAAQAAEGHVSTAQSAVTQAQQILDSTGEASEGAQSALQQAQGLLADVDGQGTSLADALVQIVSLHQETLLAHDDTITKHGQVISAHGEALQAVSDAASQASAAAADAADAADAALSAAEVQRAINETQKQINDLYARAIRAAAASGAQAGAAAMQAAMAAQEGKNAAQSALDAAATNTDSIGILEDAQGLLQTATETNADAIGKLRDAQALTNQGVRAAAAAAGQAGAASMQNSMAIQEATKSAESALEASQVLSDTIEEREKAQRIVDRQQDESLILHENQLKWARWTNPIMQFRFSEEAEVQALTGNEINTGLVDLRLNSVNGHGCEFITRPGWAGQVELRLTHIGGGENTVYGSLGNNNNAHLQVLQSNVQIRMASLKIWPQWSSEPREYVLRVDQDGRFGYMEGYENQLEGEPISHLGNGQIRFRHVSVVASEDVQILYGMSWVPVTSGEVISLGAYIRPVPGDERDGNLVVFTERQPAMRWEPGAPSSGRQDISVARQTLARSSWRTVATWTCPDWSSSVSATAILDATFSESNPIATESYIVRIMHKGTEVGRVGRNSALGMNRNFRVSESLTLSAGDRLDFQMYCSAGRSAERRVAGGLASITWG